MGEVDVRSSSAETHTLYFGVTNIDVVLSTNRGALDVETAILLRPDITESWKKTGKGHLNVCTASESLEHSGSENEWVMRRDRLTVIVHLGTSDVDDARCRGT